MNRAKRALVRNPGKLKETSQTLVFRSLNPKPFRGSLKETPVTIRRPEILISLVLSRES